MRSFTIFASIAALVAISASPALAQNRRIEKPPIFVDDISSPEAKVALSEGRVVCTNLNIDEVACYIQQLDKGKTTPVTTTLFLVRKNPSTTSADMWSRALSQMLP
jgi:hypothetical protein